jgi:polysaccharide export outer membrane protein
MSESLILYLGSLMLRSIGIAAIAGLFSWRIRNVALRHAIWVAVLGLMLLMPVFDHLLPAAWVPNRLQYIAVDSAVTSPLLVLPSASFPASQHPLPSTLASSPLAVRLNTSGANASPIGRSHQVWWKAAAATYASVSFAMLLLLVMAYRRIWNLRRTGSPISSYLWDELIFSGRIKRRIPILLESEKIRVPITIGFLKPVVLLPAGWQSWDELKLMAVLSHEFAHVRRGDWAIAALAAIAKCAYWMNPLSWFLERKLSVLAEQASDDAVILSTRNTTRYAEILLEFAAAAGNSGRYIQGGVSMAQHNMRARIERVLSNEQSGTGILKVAGWMLVLMLATPVLYSAAALQVSSERAPVPISKVGPPTASQQPRLAPVEVPPTAPALPSTPSPSAVQNPSRPAPPPIKLPVLERQQPGPEIRPVLSQSNSGTAYEIRPSDVLNIFVWKQPELSMKVTVQPDGRISIPLVQDILAAGSTLRQLKTEIERRLKLKVPDPDVTVMLESASSYRVYVVGQVAKPGPVSSDKALTVLQALALAGGLQDFARRGEISVIRANESINTYFRVNYSNLINGKEPSENLESGDVVIVP